MSASPLTLEADIECVHMAAPFRISGYEFRSVDVLVVSLHQAGCIGRAEAAGVYYHDDHPRTMLQQIEMSRGAIEAGVSHSELLQLLPPGGARNALDCALWDLEAKLTGRPVWQLTGLPAPRPVRTTFTCGADDPDKMAAAALAFESARALKLKLTGEPLDGLRIRAVRRACPDVWMSIDANQGFTRRHLEELMPVLLEARVRLIEQPLPVGQESELEGLVAPIPIFADESVQQASDIPALVGRFGGINIKLDKCGGLTEGLRMIQTAREHGLQTMVGNMIASSLGFAPAFLLAQLSDYADLDGPVFLESDHPLKMRYRDGHAECPAALWGN